MFFFISARTHDYPILQLCTFLHLQPQPLKFHSQLRTSHLRIPTAATSSSQAPDQGPALDRPHPAMHQACPHYIMSSSAPHFQSCSPQEAPWATPCIPLLLLSSNSRLSTVLFCFSEISVLSSPIPRCRDVTLHMTSSQHNFPSSFNSAPLRPHLAQAIAHMTCHSPCGRLCPWRQISSSILQCSKQTCSYRFAGFSPDQKMQTCWSMI